MALLSFADVMTSAQQAARAAAQLHEAAQDVARVAARRSARTERQTTEPFTGQRLELAENLAIDGQGAVEAELDRRGRPHGLDVVHVLCGEDGWGAEDLDGGRTGRVVWARLGFDRSGT